MQIFIAEIIVHYHYLSLLQYSNKDCLLRPEDCLETVHKQFFLSAVSGVSVFCQQSIAFLFSYWLGRVDSGNLGRLCEFEQSCKFGAV